MDIKFAGLRYGEFVVNQNSSGRHFTESMGGVRLLARRASRRPGTPLEQKMDAQILGGKGNYFQLFL